jgi:hypothetical protein
MSKYEEIALEIVPIGYRPSSVIQLREEIAEVIEKTVEREVRSLLPIALTLAKKEVDEKLQSLKRGEAEFKKIALNHLRLLTAVEKWLAWTCDAEGGVFDQKELWDEVKAAWLEYKSL